MSWNDVLNNILIDHIVTVNGTVLFLSSTIFLRSNIRFHASESAVSTRPNDSPIISA